MQKIFKMFILVFLVLGLSSHESWALRAGDIKPLHVRELQSHQVTPRQAFEKANRARIELMPEIQAYILGRMTNGSWTAFQALEHGDSVNLNLRPQAADLLVNKVNSGQLKALEVVREAEKHNLKLHDRLQEYLCPQHWQQFTVYFQSLPYIEKITNLRNLAEGILNEPFTRRVLQDISLSPLTSSSPSVFSWFQQAHGILFTENGLLIYANAVQQDFDHLLVALEVWQNLAHTEEPSKLEAVYQHILQDKVALQEAYKHHLGLLTCADQDITDTVVKEVVENRKDRQTAIDEASIRIHLSLLQQKNLGLDANILHTMAREIVLQRKSYVEALCKHLQSFMDKEVEKKDVIAHMMLEKGQDLRSAQMEYIASRYPAIRDKARQLVSDEYQNLFSIQARLRKYLVDNEFSNLHDQVMVAIDMICDKGQSVESTHKHLWTESCYKILDRDYKFLGDDALLKEISRLQVADKTGIISALTQALCQQHQIDVPTAQKIAFSMLQQKNDFKLAHTRIVMEEIAGQGLGFLMPEIQQDLVQAAFPALDIKAARDHIFLSHGIPQAGLQDFYHYLIQEKKQIDVIKPAFLLDYAAQQLHRQYNNIDFNTISFIAKSKNLSGDTALNPDEMKQILPEALRITKRDACESALCEQIAQFMLPPHNMNLSEARLAVKTDLKTAELEAGFPHLSHEELKAVARTMVEYSLTSIDASLKRIFLDQGFSEDETEIISKQVQQGKTFAEIEAEYGYASWMKEYSQLTLEEAKELSLFKRTNHFQEKQNALKQYLLNKFGDEAITQAALETFINENSSLEDSCKKARYIVSQKQSLAQKQFALQSSSTFTPEALKLIASYAYAREENLQAGLAHYLSLTVPSEDHHDFLIQHASLNKYYYQYLAHLMLEKDMDYNKAITSYSSNLQSMPQALKVAISRYVEDNEEGYFVIDHHNPEWKKLFALEQEIRDISSLFLTATSMTYEELNRHPLNLVRFKNNLQQALLAYYKVKANIQHPSYKNYPAFQPDYLKYVVNKMLLDKTGFDAALTNLSRILEDQTNVFTAAYPYLSPDAKKELAYAKILQEEDRSVSAIHKHLVAKRDEDSRINFDAYVKQLAHFMADKKGLTFNRSRESFDNFLKQKADDYAKQNWGLEPEQYKELTEEVYINEHSTQQALAILLRKILMQKETVALKEILDGTRISLPARTAPAIVQNARLRAFADLVADKLVKANGTLNYNQAIDAQRLQNTRNRLSQMELWINEPQLQLLAQRVFQNKETPSDALKKIFMADQAFNNDQNLVDREKFFHRIAELMVTLKIPYPQACYQFLVEEQKPASLMGRLELLNQTLAKPGPSPSGNQIDKTYENFTNEAQNLSIDYGHGNACQEFMNMLAFSLYLQDELKTEITHATVQNYSQTAQIVLASELLKTLDLSADTLQVRNWTAQSGDLVHLASRLYQAGISPWDILKMPPQELVIWARAHFNLTPDYVLDATAHYKAAFRAGLLKARQRQKDYLAEQENYKSVQRNGTTTFWEYDPYNPRYSEKILEAFSAFEKKQENEDIKLNVKALSQDAFLNIPDLEKDYPENVTEQEYKKIKGEIFKFLEEYRGFSYAEKSKYKDAVGRFFAWTRGHDYNRYLGEDAHKNEFLTGSEKEIYRKRIKRLYDHVLRPAMGHDDPAEAAALLSVIYTHAVSCIDASRQALECLEKRLPGKEDYTLFERIAGSLRTWRITQLELLGKKVAYSVGSSHEELEYSLFLMLAGKNLLSIYTNGTLMRYAGFVKLSPSRLYELVESDFLPNYRNSIIRIVEEAVSYKPMPTGDKMPNTVYAEQVMEWARNHPSYCNNLDLMAELMEEQNDHHVFKGEVIRNLLHYGGYIDLKDESPFVDH